MSKQSIRRLIRLRKSRLTSDKRRQQSHEIMRLLEDLPVFQRAHVILVYASLPDEVGTLDFLQRWSEKKQLLLPVVKGEVLELRRCTHLNNLQSGELKILEPLNEPLFTQYETIDLAIIPGVAFTPDGKRLGRGKGYYDRLLSNPAFRGVYKIGLAFPCQLVTDLPVDQHDVHLNQILTLPSVNSIR